MARAYLLVDDRHRIVYTERPPRSVRKDSTMEEAGSTRVRADTQPVWKMKPDTGRLRRGKK